MTAESDRMYIADKGIETVRRHGQSHRLKKEPFISGLEMV